MRGSLYSFAVSKAYCNTIRLIEREVVRLCSGATHEIIGRATVDKTAKLCAVDAGNYLDQFLDRSYPINSSTRDYREICKRAGLQFFEGLYCAFSAASCAVRSATCYAKLALPRRDGALLVLAPSRCFYKLRQSGLM